MSVVKIILSLIIIAITSQTFGKILKNQFTWNDWCERRDKRITRNEHHLINLISKEFSLNGGLSDCAKESRYVEMNLLNLKIRSTRVHKLTPLLSLKKSKRLRRLNLRSTRPSQTEISSLNFLEKLPTFIHLRLPVITRDGKVALCPFKDKSKCI